MPPPPPRTNISQRVSEEIKRKQREEMIRKHVEETMRADDAIREEEERKRKLEEENERIREERRKQEREEERRREEEDEKARRASHIAKQKAVNEKLDAFDKEMKRKRFSTYLVQEITFRHAYALRDEKVFLMLPNWANDFPVSEDVKNRFMNYRLAKEAAYSILPIKNLAYKHINFENTALIYTVYEVKRVDNKEYYICDNDLLTINPSDLLTLGKAMKRQLKEGGGDLVKMSYQRILACMKNFVTHRKQVDFQIGIDHKVTNLSIAAPNEDREGLEHLHSGQLLSDPEDGAVFRRNRRRSFFRVSEAHRYSDEVTEIVKSYAAAIKDDGSRNPELRATASRIFKKLDLLKKLRDTTTMFHKIYTNHPEAPY